MDHTWTESLYATLQFPHRWADGTHTFSEWRVFLWACCWFVLLFVCAGLRGALSGYWILQDGSWSRFLSTRLTTVRTAPREVPR